MAQQGATDTSRAPGSAAVAIRGAFWIRSGDTYSPTSNRHSATHVLEDDGAGTYTMTPIASSIRPTRMWERDGDYIIRSAL